MSSQISIVSNIHDDCWISSVTHNFPTGHDFRLSWFTMVKWMNNECTKYIRTKQMTGKKRTGGFIGPINVNNYVLIVK